MRQLYLKAKGSARHVLYMGRLHHWQLCPTGVLDVAFLALRAGAS
jgi:hypothetical protein